VQRRSLTRGWSALETVEAFPASKGTGATHGKTNQRGSRGSLSAVWNAGSAHYRPVREFADHLPAVRRLRPNLRRTKRRAGLKHFHRIKYQAGLTSAHPQGAPTFARTALFAEKPAAPLFPFYNAK
jgi:hypothetical protein